MSIDTIYDEDPERVIILLPRGAKDRLKKIAELSSDGNVAEYLRSCLEQRPEIGSLKVRKAHRPRRVSPQAAIATRGRAGAVTNAEKKSEQYFAPEVRYRAEALRSSASRRQRE
jgi:hypothetical protein